LKVRLLGFRPRLTGYTALFPSRQGRFSAVFRGRFGFGRSDERHYTSALRACQGRLEEKLKDVLRGLRRQIIGYDGRAVGFSVCFNDESVCLRRVPKRAFRGTLEGAKPPVIIERF